MPSRLSGATVSTSTAWFPAPSRAERWIAAARLLLAATSLVAIQLDPQTQAATAGSATYAVLAVYVGYALVLLLLAWTPTALRLPYQLATHVVDIAVYTLLVHNVHGPANPFFPYFTFALVVAAIRWQWVGAVGTVAVALVLYGAIAIEAIAVRRDEDFQLTRFVIRCVYLSVAAVLVGYLSALEANARAKLALLARWPSPEAEPLDAMLAKSLAHAAAVLAAPRILLVWQEAEEPVVHHALWEGSRLEHVSERSGDLGDIVAEVPARGSFFCRAVTAATPRVWCHIDTSYVLWHHRPLGDALRQRYRIESVLGARLADEERPGFLLALDRARPTFDDLPLAEIASRHMSTQLRHAWQARQMREVAVSEERVAFARDLHDGLLQSLTGAGLLLASAHGMLDTDVPAARDRLERVQDLIEEEQHGVRELLQELRPSKSSAMAPRRLADRLDALARTARSVWGIDVHLSVHASPPPKGAHDVYWIVREALTNVARHSGSASASVEVTDQDRTLRIVVADSGRGLPVKGRFDAEALERLGLGPVSVRERVGQLDGGLIVESGEHGVRLEIELPRNAAGGGT